MKHIKLFEQFINESDSSLNEAFASTKLANILTGANKLPEGLPAAFYKMTKLKLDKIKDEDIIELDPMVARREKRANAVYMYFVTDEKENDYHIQNPYDKDEEISIYNGGIIPANTLLAITNVDNKWMNIDWAKDNKYTRHGSNLKYATIVPDVDGHQELQQSKRKDSAGIDKGNTGLDTVMKVARTADICYCLDLDILTARYSTVNLKDERKAAQKGATAFISDKDFRKQTHARYQDIIADRALAMPLDKKVKEATELIGEIIANANARGHRDSKGDILIGTGSHKYKISGILQHMDFLLNRFSTYVHYTDLDAHEYNAGYDMAYHKRNIKDCAKKVWDSIKDIKRYQK